MTVAELIEALSKADPTAEVYVPDEDPDSGGYAPLYAGEVNCYSCGVYLG